jgi:hypothetical protein
MAKTAAPVNKSVWRPIDGWNSLRPGIDKLPKAISKLGTPSRIMKDDGAYYFKNDSVMVGLNLNSDVIGRIEVSPSYPDPKLMPKTMDEVYKRYGHLEHAGTTKNHGNIYKRPGLEVISDPKKAPEEVSTLSFVDPKVQE